MPPPLEPGSDGSHATPRPPAPRSSLTLSLVLSLAGAGLAQGELLDAPPETGLEADLEGAFEGEATTPAQILAVPVQGEVLYDDGETVVIHSPLEGGPAKHALDGFTLARGIVLRVRVETDRENLYFRVSDGYARYQRTTVREGRSGAARPGRIVDRDRGSGYVCEGGSSTTGSWLRCYDNGRLTYHSRCTVVRGNVSCTSRRY